MNIPQSVITNLRIKLQAAADAEPCTYRKWQWMNAIRILDEMKGVV
jgi:hypothetical protein